MNNERDTNSSGQASVVRSMASAEEKAKAEKIRAIHAAYQQHRSRAEGFLVAVRESRKMGFLVVAILNRDDDALLNDAARLLLNVSAAWPMHDLPDNFLSRNTALFDDAAVLCANATGNRVHFSLPVMFRQALRRVWSGFWK